MYVFKYKFQEILFEFPNIVPCLHKYNKAGSELLSKSHVVSAESAFS